MVIACQMADLTWHHAAMRSAFAASLAILLSACAAMADPPDAVVVELAQPRLVELSGLSYSADYRQLWGHNDSGHDAELFRTGREGEDLGVVHIRDAENVDWEDLAHIDSDEGRLLLIGDIGDNRAQRDHLVIYAVPEPAAGDSEAYPAWSLRYRYPHGARDAEGMAWDPRERALYVLTKRDTPPALYRIPLQQDGIQTAEHVADLELPPPPLGLLFSDARRALLYNLPTAMDISTDGSRMVLLTYGAAFVHDRADGEDWAQVFQRLPKRVQIPKLPQAEALALDPDAIRAMIGSEARPGLMTEVTLPPRGN